MWSSKRLLDRRAFLKSSLGASLTALAFPVVLNGPVQAQFKTDPPEPSDPASRGGTQGETGTEGRKGTEGETGTDGRKRTEGERERGREGEEGEDGQRRRRRRRGRGRESERE
jgi:hypothetical protein